MDLSLLLNALNDETAPSQLFQPCQPRSQPETHESSFYIFPRLPTELKIQIWLEAASVPRIVTLELHTAQDRSTSFIRSGRVETTDQNANPVSKVPSLLHVNHQARQVCLPIYKTRLQIPGCGNWWETYVLADHDILALNRSGLELLVASCRLQKDRVFLDRDYRWGRYRLPELTALGIRGVQTDLDITDVENLSPAIKEFLDDRMAPALVRKLRGDIGGVKRLIMYEDSVQRIWPGLYRDREIIDSLDRYFQLFACNRHLAYAERFALKEQSGYAVLPERYRRPLLPDPRPDSATRTGPAIGFSRTSLGFGDWLKWFAFRYWPYAPGCNFHNTLKGAFGDEPLFHEVFLWHFSEPRYGAGLANTAARDPVAELAAAHLQTLACDIAHDTIRVYEGSKIFGPKA